MASDLMDTATKTRLRIAAEQARRAYPGPIGDLLRQELLSWMVFGHRLGSVLIMRVADKLLATEDSQDDPAASSVHPKAV